MPTIHTDDDQSLSYRLDGPLGAPVIVLSNSLGTTQGMWDAQVHAFTQRHRVLRYDTRGHGGSDGPAGDYTLERLALDAVNLLDALEFDRVVWCGLSLGGMIGQYLGATVPDRLDRLIVANSSAFVGGAEFWNDRIATVRAQGAAALAEGIIDRWFTPEFRASQPTEVSRIRQMLLATPAVGYSGCCAAIRDMDLRPMLPGMSLPTLVIAGERDPASPMAKSEQIRDLAPNAKLVTLDAAHLSNIERPAEFSDMVLQFAAG